MYKDDNIVFDFFFFGCDLDPHGTKACSLNRPQNGLYSLFSLDFLFLEGRS